MFRCHAASQRQAGNAHVIAEPTAHTGPHCAQRRRAEGACVCPFACTRWSGVSAAHHCCDSGKRLVSGAKCGRVAERTAARGTIRAAHCQKGPRCDDEQHGERSRRAASPVRAFRVCHSPVFNMLQPSLAPREQQISLRCCRYDALSAVLTAQKLALQDYAAQHAAEPHHQAEVGPAPHRRALSRSDSASRNSRRRTQQIRS